MHHERKGGPRGGVGGVQREAGRQCRLVRSQGRHTADRDAAFDEGVMEEMERRSSRNIYESLPVCATPRHDPGGTRSLQNATLSREELVLFPS